MSKTTYRTCLWYEKDADKAAERYVELFEDAEIEHVYPNRGDPAGSAFLVYWRLGDQHYSGLNGGPHYTLSPAASIEVHLDTQDEIDRLWSGLLDGGGKALQCGWLTDPWGVSWQIVPRRLIQLLLTKDDEVAGRVTQAMVKMVKLDIAALEAAAKG